MPAGNTRPDLSGLLLGEQVERDGVARRRKDSEDVALEGAATARSALGYDCKGLQPGFQKSDRAVVPGMSGHGRGWNRRDASSAAGRVRRSRHLSCPALFVHFPYKVIIEGS